MKCVMKCEPRANEERARARERSAVFAQVALAVSSYSLSESVLSSVGGRMFTSVEQKKKAKP